MTRLKPASDVATTEEDGTVYAAHLPDGPIVVLDGIAAPDVIRADVEAFVDDLVARGLLEQVERRGDPSGL